MGRKDKNIMNNTALTAFIAEYGNRMYCINSDNNRFIYVG